MTDEKPQMPPMPPLGPLGRGWMSFRGGAYDGFALELGEGDAQFYREAGEITALDGVRRVVESGTGPRYLIALAPDEPK